MVGEKVGKRMSGKITELYTDADMARMEQRVKRWRTALLALAAGALAVCVGLVAAAGTMNAQRMELATIAVSTVMGWVAIYGVVFKLTPVRRELAHARMLRREQRQAAQGRIVVTDERFTIRKSVPVQRVEVRDGEQTQRFLVCAGRAEALAAAGTGVLYTCHGYAAAYEVTQ